MCSRPVRWKGISGYRVTGPGMMISMIIIGCRVIGRRLLRLDSIGRLATGAGSAGFTDGMPVIGVRMSDITAALTTAAVMAARGIMAGNGMGGVSGIIRR